MKKTSRTGAIPSKVPGKVQNGIVRTSPNTGKGGTVRKGGGNKKGGMKY